MPDSVSLAWVAVKCLILEAVVRVADLELFNGFFSCDEDRFSNNFWNIQSFYTTYIKEHSEHWW